MKNTEADNNLLGSYALEREFRDIPLWVAKDYVRELPGAIETPTGFSGPGWRIELTKLSPVEIGALTFRRLRFVLSGNQKTVEEVWKQLEHKFYRGGA